MTNKTYDIIKSFLMTIIPATIALLTGLNSALEWNLPMDLITFVLTTIHATLGTYTLNSSKKFWDSEFAIELVKVLLGLKPEKAEEVEPKAEEPKVEEPKEAEEETPAKVEDIQFQRLILPLNEMHLTSSHEGNPSPDGWNGYYNYFNGKYGHHYGIDVTGSTRIDSLGNGIVLYAGTDAKNGDASKGMGIIAVILYDACINPIDNVLYERGIIATFCHMADVIVKEGQRVTKDAVIGHVGNTGANTTGKHLHLQLDTDVDHPFGFCGGFGGSAYVLQKGPIDSTINPIHVLHVKESAPDYQSAMTINWDTTRHDETNIMPRIQ